MAPTFNLPDRFSDNSLLIYGAGGHGKTLIDLIRAAGGYDLAGMIDDSTTPGSRVMGLPVLGGPDILPELYRRGLRLAVNGVGGINRVDVRLTVFNRLIDSGFSFPSAVDPRAWVEPSAVLADGVQVLAFAYVGTEAVVGFGSVLNVGACLSHDVKTGMVNNFSPGAMIAGNVTFGDYTQVGMAATVNVGINVGSRVRIGNGATVKKDIPDSYIVRAGFIYPEG